MSTLADRLDEVRARRAVMSLSVVEGALYAGMVGLGEFWFVADAVRLDAPTLVIAALVTVPFLVGALGALGMLRALRSARSRQPLVIAAVVVQGLGLALLSGLSALGATTPTRVLLFACLHHAAAQAAGVGWASWFGEVVPARVRGRWFGQRNRWVHGTTFAGIAVGGLTLYLLEPTAADAAATGGTGYALLYGAASLLRLACAVLLARSWEPPFVGPDAADDPFVLLRQPEGGAARGVVGLGAAMMLAVCVATPFFAPHMLETLRFSYPMYLGTQGVHVTCKVLTLGLWGRLIDRAGPVPAYRLAAVMVALVPVPWVFADRAWVVYLAEALSGIAWGGHEVAMVALTLAAVGPQRRAVLLAGQSLANGTAQSLGGLVGTGLSSQVHGQHAVMFGASAVARLLVAVLLVPMALAPLTRERWKAAQQPQRPAA